MISNETRSEEPPAGLYEDQRVNLTFRRIVDSGLCNGCTYQVLFRSAAQKTSLKLRLASLHHAALVATDGGLISNLTAQENILLPAQYHPNLHDPLVTAKAAAELFARFGLPQGDISRIMRSLPAHLSLFEKRLAGFARAMAVEPDVLICDTVFEGLSDREAAIAGRFDELFHLHFPFRTVIFLELDYAPSIIKANDIFQLQ